MLLTLAAVVAAAVPVHLEAAQPSPEAFQWRTVVNNGEAMPGDPLGRKFNSYNQPSVNAAGLVVVRARSAGGGGQPANHGIYARDMSAGGGPLVTILDRATEVPFPNNLSTRFVETPSFPRIDMGSPTIVTRGNHQPTWTYLLPDGTETRAGTTGIYANPFGDLITGASKLGAVPSFEFFEVPGAASGTVFDVFPGTPSVTDGSTIVFKGNYTVGGEGKTGVFYRDLEDADMGGEAPVVSIANNTETLIPGTRTLFGSTAPPSAAGRRAVFAGFDDEDHPALGGLYRVDLGNKRDEKAGKTKLEPLVRIGGRVPGERVSDTFNRFGEGLAFDGRYVGFWAAWGAETATVRLYCPQEGNKDRIAYCNRRLVCADGSGTYADPDSICDPGSSVCYQEKEVPVRQGIFVHDTESGNTWVVARSGADFDDFVFWNYSGKAPCTGQGHGEEGAEDDGEPARWRFSAFVAVSAAAEGTFRAAFKARTGELVGGAYDGAPVDGIYLAYGPGRSRPVPVVETGMDGQAIDSMAPPGSSITALGLEREGLRGDWLAVTVTMGLEGGVEEEGMAGIYLTRVPKNPPR